jgi:hypothetical protein
MRVISPLRLSERTEDSTSVEPFSDGASRAAHSSSPAFSDCSVSRSCTSSHSSSRTWDAACSSARRASSMGGHTAVDMAVISFHGTATWLLCFQACSSGSTTLAADLRFYPRKGLTPAHLTLLPWMRTSRCTHRSPQRRSISLETRSVSTTSVLPGKPRTPLIASCLGMMQSVRDAAVPSEVMELAKTLAESDSHAYVTAGRNS